MATIADILLAKGNAAALAGAQQGNIYGNMIRQIGAAPGELVDSARQRQQDQQRQQLVQAQLAESQQNLARGGLQLTAAQQAAQDQIDVRNLWARAPIDATTGRMNTAQLADFLQKEGKPYLLEPMMKQSTLLNNGVDEDAKASDAAQQRRQSLLGQAAVGIRAANYDPGFAHATFTHLSNPNQPGGAKVSADEANQILNSNDPKELEQLLAPYLVLSPEGRPKYEKFGQGDQPLDVNNPAAVAAFRTTPKPPTAEEDAAEIRRLLAKKVAFDAKRGPGLTPDEQDKITAYNQSKNVTPTLADQAMDAYAVSIGKTNRSQLTYPEIQNFEKNKAMVASGIAVQQHARERQFDVANPVPEKAKSQDALEQEYRTVLTRAISGRSGGIGLEDAKVQQANHLLALLDQTYDPKAGAYNIPRVLQTELAMGLAKLVAPGGTVGVQMEQEINQRTAKGDLAGALTYITGTPVNATTQNIAKMYKDSIERQGQVAMQNREGNMAYLRGLAPSDLAEDRRVKLEATTLNPLRQSRVIANPQTGERRLQVSLDGGVTWK